MTRYSASRGILYSAPPGPGGHRSDANESADESTTDGAETDDPSIDAESASVDVTADD